MAGMSKDGLPNTFKIELVEGCNRMCSFCGIHTMWKKKEHRVLKFMELDLVEQAAISIKMFPGCEKKRIEFALHGEPSLHPDAPKAIEIFRKHLPQAQILFTTNGLTFIQRGSSYVKELFNAGVNFLLVDTYVTRPEIMSVLKRSAKPIRSFFDEDSPFPYQYHGSDLKVIIDMDDLGSKTGVKVTKKLENHAGNGNAYALMKFGVLPLNAPLQKKCSRPFREMVINYDGSVTICCVDWCHELIMGRFPEDGHLKTIWYGEPFQHVRALLKSNKRGFIPCQRCDYRGGFRLGLLPPVVDVPDATALETIRGCYERYGKYRHPAARNPLEMASPFGMRGFL